jgi:hypothetical protein
MYADNGGKRRNDTAEPGVIPDIGTEGGWEN